MKFNVTLSSLIFLVAFFLMGCSSHHCRIVHFKHAAKISKLRSKKIKHHLKYRVSYTIAGHRYQVLKTAKGYNKKGMASWYGPGFQKHLTSSNTRYNMYAMTAASPSLPLNTYVRVTNLKNRRSVIVKVNDRGPFAKNRIMDLSYSAAKKLGMLHNGVAYVDVQALNSKQSATV